jgi:hypothetical protein
MTKLTVHNVVHNSLQKFKAFKSVNCYAQHYVLLVSLVIV